MKEHLYSVGLEHKKTEERIDLQVWARNTDEATHKLTGVLIGYSCTYRWTGSGPVYENNRIITREIRDE